MKNNKLLKVALLALIGIPTIFYSSILGFNLDRLIVFEPNNIQKPIIKEFKNKTQIKQFQSNDKLNITYWHIAGSKKLPTILYCHGNAENISHFQERVKFLAENGYEIFMIDYRGYGESEGFPTEAGVYSDTEQMIKHLKTEYGIDRKNLVIWGHSMGGGVVSEVTSKMEFKAVILEATFTKLAEMKTYAAEFRSSNKVEEALRRAFYTLIPTTQKFENINKIAKIHSPLLVLHSKPDEIVPYEMSVELVKKNKNANLYISETGAHEEPYWNNNVILKFLKELK